MNRIFLSLAVALCGFTFTVKAQNVPPTVTSQIADFTVYAGVAARSIDLTTAFTDPDAPDAVRLGTPLGNIDIVLFGSQKPITVANFLRYINESRYFITDPTTHQIASSFFHRSVPGFVIQGGGFLGTVDPASPGRIQPTDVTTFAPIQNEPGISNTRGTIAMAKLGGDPNSASSQWFINLADNGGAPNNLDTQNGGFTVFGRVVGNGMAVVDAIAALPIFNGGGAFTSLPLRNYVNTNPVAVENLVSIPSIISPLLFSAVSDNPSIASVAISNKRLLVAGHQTGTARITVTATDIDGGESIAQGFNVTVTTEPARLVNIATRMEVGTDDNVMIAGFIIRGTSPKRVVVRAVGPSLTQVSNTLSNPMLELHGPNGFLLTNDNWQENANRQEIIDADIAPTVANESTILTTLPASTDGIGYTAIVSGVNRGVGVGLVQVFDVDSGPGSTILNISTRGRVGIPNNNYLIGGIILRGNGSKRIVVRAVGPSLAPTVPGTLSNPTLELRDPQGMLLALNDDWQTGPDAGTIRTEGLAPSDARESALLGTLAPGAYTAIVSGVGDTTGVASVEAYQLP